MSRRGRTSDLVTFPRCHAETSPRLNAKIRRYEDTKVQAVVSVPPPAACGRLQRARELQIQAAIDNALLVFAVLRLPDARSAWRRTPCVSPAGALGASRVGFICPSSFLRIFVSSTLTVGTNQLDREICSTHAHNRGTLTVTMVRGEYRSRAQRATPSSPARSLKPRFAVCASSPRRTNELLILQRPDRIDA